MPPQPADMLWLRTTAPQLRQVSAWGLEGTLGLAGWLAGCCVSPQPAGPHRRPTLPACTAFPPSHRAQYRSPMHGWGLFAGADIPRDTFLIEYVGEVVDNRTAGGCWSAGALSGVWVLRVGGGWLGDDWRWKRALFSLRAGGGLAVPCRAPSHPSSTHLPPPAPRAPRPPQTSARRSTRPAATARCICFAWTLARSSTPRARWAGARCGARVMARLHACDARQLAGHRSHSHRCRCSRRFRGVPVICPTRQPLPWCAPAGQRGAVHQPLLRPKLLHAAPAGRQHRCEGGRVQWSRAARARCGLGGPREGGGWVPGGAGRRQAQQAGVRLTHPL